MTQARTKIGLLHHVGGGNLGDDATLHAVAENIMRRWRNAEVVALSMNPDDTKTRHGLMSYPIRRRGWSIGYRPTEVEAGVVKTVRALTCKNRAVYNLLKAANLVIRAPSEIFRELVFLKSSRHNITSLDLLIICGGGQLTEKDGPWGFPYTIFKWVVLAKAAGVRCMFLNLGAGPLTHLLSKSFVRISLLAAQYVSFRDRKSLALAREIGFMGKSQVYPDSAYGLEVAATKGNLITRRARPIVGFAPMPHPGSRAYLAAKDQIVYNQFIHKLASFASWLVDQSYLVTTFGTDIGVDPSAIRDFQMALSDRCGITASQQGIDHSVRSVHELLATVAGMDYVVTCRFHGVVFAHLLNKPVLAIAHHPKVMELMTDLELSSYCVDIWNFDPRLLTERFALMIANAEDIKGCMAASLKKNRERLSRQFDELFQLHNLI